MILAGAAKAGIEGFLKVHRSVAGDTISMKNHAMFPDINQTRLEVHWDSPFRFNLDGAENRPHGTS